MRAEATAGGSTGSVCAAAGSAVRTVRVSRSIVTGRLTSTEAGSKMPRVKATGALQPSLLRAMAVMFQMPEAEPAPVKVPRRESKSTP